MTAFLQPAPDFLTGKFVTRFGGTNEIIIRKIHLASQITEILTDLVGKRLRRHTFILSGNLDLLTMFIGTGQKGHIKTV